MKHLYLSAAMLLTLATGAQAQDSMADMAMEGMNMPTHQAAPSAHAEGTIKALDEQSGKVTLAHGPVAALQWPAMTMGFQATPAQLKGLQPGDHVSFDFRMDGSTARIVNIGKP